MAKIIIFDPNTNLILDYRESVNGPDYAGKPDVIVFDDDTEPKPPLSESEVKTLIESVPLKYLIQDKGSFREMDQSEKDQVDADEAAVEALAEKEAAKAVLVDRHFDALIEVFNDQLNILRVKAGVAILTKDEALAIVQGNIDGKP